MWRNKISPKMLSFEIWWFFHQKETFWQNIPFNFYFSHFGEILHPKKKNPNTLTEYSFYFYFLHFGEISHPKNNKFTDEIFLYVYLIVTFWQIFALNKTPNMYWQIIHFYIYFSHFGEKFCTKQNAKYIDRLFLFILICQILAKFLTKKRQIYWQNILFYIYFSHFGEVKFCTKQNAKYTDRLFLFIFIFSHFCEISHPKNARIFYFIYFFHILAKFRTK